MPAVLSDGASFWPVSSSHGSASASSTGCSSSAVSELSEFTASSASPESSTTGTSAASSMAEGAVSPTFFVFLTGFLRGCTTAGPFFSVTGNTGCSATGSSSSSSVFAFSASISSCSDTPANICARPSKTSTRPSTTFFGAFKAFSSSIMRLPPLRFLPHHPTGHPDIRPVLSELPE